MLFHCADVEEGARMTATRQMQHTGVIQAIQNGLNHQERIGVYRPSAQ